jgi:hypothetical protein
MWPEKRGPLRRRSGANGEAGPKGEGQDARSKERPPRFRASRTSGNCSCVASTRASMPSPVRKVRESGPGFSSGLLPARKGVAIPGNARCVACRPRLTAAEGPRVEQRAIVARTIQKSHGKSKGRCLRRRYSSLVGKRERTALDGLLSTQSCRSQNSYRPEAVIIKRCPAIMSCRVLALRSALLFLRTFAQTSAETGSKTAYAIP